MPSNFACVGFSFCTLSSTPKINLHSLRQARCLHRASCVQSVCKLRASYRQVKLKIKNKQLKGIFCEKVTKTGFKKCISFVLCKLPASYPFHLDLVLRTSMWVNVLYVPMPPLFFKSFSAYAATCFGVTPLTLMSAARPYKCWLYV